MKTLASILAIAVLAVACGAQRPTETTDTASQDIVVHGPYECALVSGGAPYTDGNNPVLNGPYWCFSAQEVGYTVPSAPNTFIPHVGQVQHFPSSLAECGYLYDVCYGIINCSTNNTAAGDPNIFVTNSFQWIAQSGVWYETQSLHNVVTGQSWKVYVSNIFFPGSC